jgi:hypothetical protein
MDQKILTTAACSPTMFASRTYLVMGPVMVLLSFLLLMGLRVLEHV